MNELFSSLAGLLRSENKVIRSLIDLCQQEEKALIKNDPYTLIDINQQQENDLTKLAELEEERAAVQSELARFLNLNEDVVLSDVLPYATEKKVQLQEAAEEIKSNHRELQQQNETNKLLIRQSLSFINQMLQVMRAEGGATYDTTGQVNDAGNIALVDKSV